MRNRFKLFSAALVLILTYPAFAQSLTTMQNAATATGNGTPLPVRASGSPTGAVVQLNGPFSATISWEATLDGTNWYYVPGYNLSTQTTSTQASVTGIYTFFCPGVEFLRARISSYTSGNVTAIGRATNVSSH